MSDTAPRSGRAERTDYQATSDPALPASADRGESQLLGYRQLYELWERQHWATQDIDFAQDRVDWHERIEAEERFQRMYGLSAFFIGEQRVAAELGPMMRAVPDEDMRIFLCTQIADEARHVAFFDRFYGEVGVLESDNLQDRLEENAQYVNREFGVLFDEMLHSRVDRLAREPEDAETLVETVTLYHMVIEGMLALTGQHFIMDYNERVGTLPGFVEGFTRVARDEHRHVAFGARSPAPCPWARASAATWPAATTATWRRSSARWSRSGRWRTPSCARRGWRAMTTSRRCSASPWPRRARSRCARSSAG